MKRLAYRIAFSLPQLWSGSPNLAQLLFFGSILSWHILTTFWIETFVISALTLSFITYVQLITKFIDSYFEMSVECLFEMSFPIFTTIIIKTIIKTNPNSKDQLKLTQDRMERQE